MKTIKQLLVFIIFFSQFFLGYSQANYSNYEKKYKDTSLPSKVRLEYARRYAAYLYSNDKKEEASRIFDESIHEALKIQSYDNLVLLYGSRAMLSRLDGRVTESENYTRLARTYLSKSQTPEAYGNFYYYEGVINHINKKPVETIKSFLKSIDYLEKAPTSQFLTERKINVYKEISVQYSEIGELALEEKYSNMYYDLAMKQSDADLKFNAEMRMGYLYDQKFGANPEDEKYRKAAEKHYLSAYNLYKTYPKEMMNESSLSYVAINLANYYLGYDNAKAEEFAKIANEVSLRIKVPIHIASSYGILADLAIEDGDYEKANQLYLSSLAEITKSKVRDTRIELSILESLSHINELKGNLSEALRYHKSYMETYQEIFNQDKVALTRKLETEFEKERQEQKYVKLQLETDKKEQQIRLMAILRSQQEQLFNNLKLKEENQREKLKLSEVQSQKRAQQLRLSKLESQQKTNDLNNFKRILDYKEKINKYYIFSIIICAIFIALLLYAIWERIKRMKQRDKLHDLALEQEKQNTKISTLTALLEGQEKERGRLARDLHDGLGGLLSSTKLQLSHLNDSADDERRKGISKSIDQIDDAVSELRRVAHNLMPDLLVKYGFEAAIKEFATRMSQDNLEIHAEFLNYQNSLSEEKQLLTYRIIQELVNNAMKHANATEIIIQFSEDENTVLAIVEDNGKGFNSDELNLEKSAGFHNIQSRIQFLKAQMNISSEVNVGTTVELQIPKK